ncbi:MAG: thiamine-phosphate kinase [Solirubrobacteraceae bacterium]
MNELELIAELGSLLPAATGRVVRGVGDDAAVVRAQGYAVTSVDTMVDGVHFRAAEMEPGEVGERALAGALSDLAAMGALPGEAYLALGMPAGTSLADARALIQGAAALAETFGVVIAGGDVTAAPALIVSFTVVGWTEDPGQLACRDGAQPGDLVGVTGSLGGSAAGLAVATGRASTRFAADLRARYTHPQPRLGEGRALALAGVSAMLDLSDGLASDGAHIARASGVTLRVDLASLPLASGVAEVAGQLHEDPASFAARGGEDYELLFCAAESSAPIIEAALADLGSRLTWIGRVTEPDASQPTDGDNTRRGRLSFRDRDGSELTLTGGYEHSF